MADAVLVIGRKMFRNKPGLLIFPALLTAAGLLLREFEEKKGTPHVGNVVPRLYSLSEVEKARGLLTGFSHVGDATQFSGKIILNDAAGLLKDDKSLYNSALKDANGDIEKLEKNMEEIEKNAEEFIYKKEVWDRAELKVELNDIISKRGGKFVCELGGKDTGKSLVLKEIEKENLTKVFIVDLREHGPDILKGLKAVLVMRKGRLEEFAKQLGANVATEATGLAAGFATKVTRIDFVSIAKVIEEILKTDEATQTLQSLIKTLVESLGPGVTLIIDEANLAFTITEDTTKEEIAALKLALALLTKLTKQDNQV